jgi:hypothetical protein
VDFCSRHFRFDQLHLYPFTFIESGWQIPSMKLEMFDRSAMRNPLPFGRGISLIRALVLSVLALSSFPLCSGTVLAQSSNLGASGNSVAGDRGEQEAEQIVALSPDKIIELLRAEPGLLLEVKKLLVREAFAQGRLLTPADLEDEALFRLLWEDEHARVLATREIERRKYVRAMPTEAEEQAQEKLDWQAGRVGRAGWSSQPQAAGAEQGTTRGDTLGRWFRINLESPKGTLMRRPSGSSKRT